MSGLLIPQYPWDEGDRLYASALNAAIANSPYLVNTGILNVLDFKAKGDGVTDDTEAINEALATGHTIFFPAGTYLVTDALNITTMGQRVYGDGAANTIIQVPATFNMAARGVFAIEANLGTNYSVPGPTIEGLTIQFNQVDTSVKANLIHFPPAVFITNTLRWRVLSVRIMRGWDGIYAYGNISTGPGVGGGRVDELQGGCLNTNIYIDGSTDTLRVNNPHIWPFGLTANQQQIFFDPTQCVGIQIARADDFHITNGLFFVGMGIRLTTSANGSSYGTIADIDFDSYSGIEVIAGLLTIASCLFLIGASRTGLALLGNASVVATSVAFADTSPGAQAVTCYPPTGSGVTLVLSGCTFGMGQYNLESAININSNPSPGTATVTVSGCSFSVDPTVSRGNAVVLCQSDSSTLVMSGCQITPKVAGNPGSLFIQITGAGTSHRISGNSSPGWPNAIPVGCAYDYPEFYQQSGGAADLNTQPVPWSGFGIRNYIQPSALSNWPPNTGPSLAVLDVYTANTMWGVQLSFGYNTDGLWHRWQSAGSWQPWQQIVTTYGSMRMHGGLDFDNQIGVRFFDTSGASTVSVLVGPDDTLLFDGSAADGSVRNIASMTQLSDTSSFDFSVPITYPGMVRLSDVDAAVDAALARHGLL